MKKRVRIPTKRDLKKYADWLFSLDGDALCSLAAAHFNLAVQKIREERTHV